MEDNSIQVLIFLMKIGTIQDLIVTVIDDLTMLTHLKVGGIRKVIEAGVIQKTSHI